VSCASVSIGGDEIGRIGRGLVVFVGISREDTEAEARYIVDKVAGLRIFDDEAGRFDHSALDVEAELLIVSQFTLYGNTRKGRRPSFTDAAPPEQAEALFSQTVDLFAATGLKVQTGRFRAHMMVSICNDGPVTIMLDSGDKERPRRG
jgi:D-tyrosyl-tRNA(Tyr) deacylase